MLGRLAQRLNCAPEQLSIEDGAFFQDGNPTGHDYWSFAGPEDFAAEIEGSAQPKPHTAYKVVGQPVPRRDLIAKVMGAAFIHDMVRPDLLHARAVRQPSRLARLTALDAAHFASVQQHASDGLPTEPFDSLLSAGQSVPRPAPLGLRTWSKRRRPSRLPKSSLPSWRLYERIRLTRWPRSARSYRGRRRCRRPETSWPRSSG